MHRLVLAASAVALLSLSCASCATPTKPVPLPEVDLQRMGGGWYIVATIPNALEHGVIAGYDVFTVQSPAVIREDFYMQRSSFSSRRIHATTRITVQPHTGNADWRVHLFGLVSLPFQVFYTDPDYRFVLFGEQDRKWGWIYSRTQTLSPADYQRLLARFTALGYDASQFRKFVQTPDQIGQPGYWNDGIR
jgi:apolipoprotein D and lipocalin family protein